MRALAVMFFMVLGIVPLLGGHPEATDDPYSLAIVNFELQMRSGKRVIHGFSQKRLPELGDRVSVALLKLLPVQRLSDLETIRTFLPIIRDAFAETRFVSVKADKRPQVTLFLLDYLQQRIIDDQIQLDIQQTIEFVKEKTEDAE